MSNPSSVHFEIDHAMENPAWDELVARSTGAHHEQTTAWARRKQHHGWQAYRIIVHQKGRAIGGAQVLHRRILKLVSIGYISRGPISESADLLALVTRQVNDGLKITAHAYVVMLPSYRWQNIVPTLLGNEFYPKPSLLLPGHPVTATSIIDLNQDLNALFAKTRASVRNNIRRGLKGGLEVVQGRETDIGTMHRLLCQLCARRGIDPSPASAQELHDIWHCLAPHGLVKIFLCRYQSEIVSAAFTFVCGSSMLVAKVGWSGEHEELRPNHVMWWEMIKWAKEAGLKQFDLHHLVTEHAKAILRGEAVIEDSYSGVTQFKLGFGGDVIVIPDCYYRSFNFAGQAALKLGGAKLLTKGRVQRWANRLAHDAPPQSWYT